MSSVEVRNVISPDGGVADNLKPVTASAWVNLAGEGTVSILDSHNVSGLVDVGVGLYDVVFETAMTNASYGVVATRTQNTNVNASTTVLQDGKLSTSCTVASLVATTGAAEDAPELTALFFGGQS